MREFEQIPKDLIGGIVFECFGQGGDAPRRQDEAQEAPPLHPEMLIGDLRPAWDESTDLDRGSSLAVVPRAQPHSFEQAGVQRSHGDQGDISITLGCLMPDPMCISELRSVGSLVPVVRATGGLRQRSVLIFARPCRDRPKELARRVEDVLVHVHARGSAMT